MNFLSRMVILLRLKVPVCPIIHTKLKGEKSDLYVSQVY